MKDIPNFMTLRKRYDEVAVALKIACCNYLREIIKAHGNIDFDDFDYAATIAYDGGNHPEYASTLCSTVYSIYINHNDELCFEIEDEDMITDDRVLLSDLSDITEIVYDKLKNDNQI